MQFLSLVDGWPRYISQHPEPPACCQPGKMTDGSTPWRTVDSCVEGMTPVQVACSGAQSMEPGRSISPWMLKDIIMSPGLQILALAHTSWEAGNLRPGRRQDSSNRTEARSRDSHLNIQYSIYTMCWCYDDYNCVYYSETCGIEDPDTQTVVITGGYLTGRLSIMNTVSLYGIQGWIEDLPSLNYNRYQHACSSYMSGGSRVRHCMKEKLECKSFQCLILTISIFRCSWSLGAAQIGWEHWTPLRCMTPVWEAG